MAAAALLGLLQSAAAVESPGTSLTPVDAAVRFTQNSGEELYRAICRGCHMDDGQGATGAGTYPSLKNNPKLAAGQYPVLVIINGQRSMPSFGRYLTDQQVVALVNYIRTQFGNAYEDAVSMEDVAIARPRSSH